MFEFVAILLGVLYNRKEYKQKSNDIYMIKHGRKEGKLHDKKMLNNIRINDSYDIAYGWLW